MSVSFIGANSHRLDIPAAIAERQLNGDPGRPPIRNAPPAKRQRWSWWILRKWDLRGQVV
jgi:hypothetical protein